MFDLFLIGSLSFWILILIEFILLLALVEYERPGLGFLSLLGVGILLKVFADVNLLEYVIQFPWHTALGALGYFTIGTVWSIFKWYFFVREKREKYLAAKEEYEKSPERSFQRERGAVAEVTDFPTPWEKSMVRSMLLNSKHGIIPLPGDNKSRILMWMAYWPWSAFWTLINDSVKKVYKFIYENISGLLLRISKAAFKDVE